MSDTALSALRDVSLSNIPLDQMRAALAEYTEKRQELLAWVQGQLVEGTHFGYPPGCEPRGNVDEKKWKSKPSLYKAGAELLIELMGVRPEFSSDRETWEQLGAKHGTVCMLCRLVSRKTGEVVGEGRGVFKVGEKKMAENSAVKMCEKRAKVDAVLNAFNLSELWAQDLEEPDYVIHPTPPADSKAPQVPPRGQGVTNDDVDALEFAFASKMPKDKHNAQAFYAWVTEATGRKFDPSQLSQWHKDDLTRCVEALGGKE